MNPPISLTPQKQIRDVVEPCL